MFSLAAAVVLGTLVSVHADRPFILRDCGPKNNAWAKLKSAKVSPNPVPLPGELTASAELEMYRNLTKASLKVEVNINRHLAVLWVPIPCIRNVGSCTYDLCDLLARIKGGCPLQLKKDNIPCTCDTIKAGTYKLNSRTFTIRKLSWLWSWFAEGDYKVDINVIDKASGNEVGCVHGEVSTVDGNECSGFLCSILG